MIIIHALSADVSGHAVFPMCGGAFVKVRLPTLMSNIRTQYNMHECDK